MNIVQCDGTWQERWQDFVMRAPGASFYHRFEWQEINRACFGHRCAYLTAVDGDRVVGVFPIVQVKSRLFGNIGCSLPFVNYGGPVGETSEVVAALLDAGREVANEWRVEYVEIRSRGYLGDELPAAEHKVSMTVDLDRDPETLWKAFKTDHRKDIRKGYKNGMTARLGGVELLDQFFAIFCESWRDLGTPVYSKSYFERILAAFGAAVRICVVYHGEEPAAAAFDGMHAGTGEGMWLGTRAKYRRSDAGYILYWELLKASCEQGLQRYHLGRSSVQSGGEVFKRKWNARPEQLYWHYLLRTRRGIPQLNVTNAKYQIAINAWRRLPIAVTQVVGPYIARSIP